MHKITDAELEIMKVIWKKKKATSNEIISELKHVEEWNPNTVKTLITRLLNKGAIEGIKYNAKSYIYRPLIKESDYTTKEETSFLQKLYNGSVNKMLFNFVKAKRISKSELEYLRSLLNDDKEE